MYVRREPEQLNHIAYDYIICTLYTLKEYFKSYLVEPECLSETLNIYKNELNPNYYTCIEWVNVNKDVFTNEK